MALLPGQTWRLAARDAHKLTRGYKGVGALARRVHLAVRAEPLATPPLDGASATRHGDRPASSSSQREARGSAPWSGRHSGGSGGRADGTGPQSARSVQPDGAGVDLGTSSSGGDGGGEAGGFRTRSAWIGVDRRRRSRKAGARAAAARPLPAALSDERVVPLMRKAERDVLPDDEPNTPWRRLAYQLRLAPSISDLLALYRSYRENETVWRPHMTALALTRTGALLYPRAVAAAASMQAEGRVDSSGRFPPPALKRDATSLFESLSGKVNKLSVRQVQGLHLARLLVSMAWLEAAGDKCDALAAALIRELLRQRGGKLAQVALVDPPLFGRLVRALAQLAPGNGELWVDLQRLTLAALMEAQGEAAATAQVGAAGGGAPRRVWAGTVSTAAAAAAAAAPPSRPDCSTADLANMAFGFAAAGAATPQLFAALRAAVLSRELPADPDALARLMCAWGRARMPLGPLLYRILDAFLPLLETAPPRPIGRLVWSLAMLGVRDERLLRAAAKAIVGRRLVFSSPQELVNVVWAYSHLGWQVEEGAEPLRPVVTRASTLEGEEEEDEEAAARGRPRGMVRRPPEQLLEVAAAGEVGARSPGATERQQQREEQQQRDGAEQGEDRGTEGWEAELTAAVEVGGRGRTLDEQQSQASSSSSSSTLGTSSPAGSAEGVAQGSGRGSDNVAAAAAGDALRDAGGTADGRASSSSSLASGRVGSHEQGEPPPAAGGAAQPLKPLPLSSALAAREQAREALLQPPPDYPEHFALFRYLGRSFIHRQIGGHGPSGGAAAAHQVISCSQLAVLVGSFARAGYKSKQLFYTTARIALLRLQYLSPADLTLILSAHARLRIPHTGLFEAACPILEARCGEFSPGQLADVLWAVQSLMPHDTYVQLANVVRARRGWRPPPSPPPRQRRLEMEAYEQEDEEELDEEEEEGGVVLEESEAAASGRGRGGQGYEEGRGSGGGGPLLPSLMRLRIPRELLEDVDWIDAEEEEEGGEVGGGRRAEGGGGWGGSRLGSMDEEEAYWARGRGASGPAQARPESLGHENGAVGARQWEAVRDISRVAL